MSKGADSHFQAIDRAAFASKNLHNGANFIVRQSYSSEGAYLNQYEMRRRMQEHDAYNALPAKGGQWALRLLEKNWQSYCAARAAWQADPSTFLARPRRPGD